jgi:hypothetical protein
LPQDALLDLAGDWAESAGGPLTDRKAPPGRLEYELLHRNGSYEVWQVIWPQGARLELHDYGCSSGAFLVTAGRLLEHFTERAPYAQVVHPSMSGREAHETTAGPIATPRFRSRVVGSGEGVAFDHHYVHRILNPAGPPAASVHVYSPPLCVTRFYRASSSGLVVARTESTESVWARSS